MLPTAPAKMKQTKQTNKELALYLMSFRMYQPMARTATNRNIVKRYLLQLLSKDKPKAMPGFSTNSIFNNPQSAMELPNPNE